MRREDEQYLRSIPELTPIHTAKSPFTEFVVVIEIVRRRAQFLQRENPPRGGILPPPLPPAKPKQLFFTRQTEEKALNSQPAPHQTNQKQQNWNIFAHPPIKIHPFLHHPSSHLTTDQVKGNRERTKKPVRSRRRRKTSEEPRDPSTKETKRKRTTEVTSSAPQLDRIQLRSTKRWRKRWEDGLNGRQSKKGKLWEGRLSTYWSGGEDHDDGERTTAHQTREPLRLFPSIGIPSNGPTHRPEPNGLYLK